MRAAKGLLLIKSQKSKAACQPPAPLLQPEEPLRMPRLRGKQARPDLQCSPGTLQGEGQIVPVTVKEAKLIKLKKDGTEYKDPSRRRSDGIPYEEIKARRIAPGTFYGNS